MLVAVAGLSGAGKTTAVEYLARCGVGRIVYVGEFVLSEVRARGLTETPANEQIVRMELRETFGPAVLAERALRELDLSPSSTRVLLDAICVVEEANCYRMALGAGVRVIGIHTDFEVRLERLTRRPTRPLSRQELDERDRFESDRLGVPQVVETADFQVSNNGSIAELEQALNQFAKTLS